MKKQCSRILSVLLCVLILTPCLLAGCGKKNPSTNTPTDSTQKQTSYTEGDDPQTEPSTLVIYPEFDERIRRDYMYTVSVTQGDKTATLPVYDHSAVNGTTRNPLDTSADEHRRFSTFAFDPAGGGVRVDIRVNRDFESYSVIPSAKKFRNQFSKGVISVWLDQPDYFVIRLNGMDSTILSVFADEPETDVPTKDSKTIIVEDWMDVEGGVLQLTKPNTTVYIKPGAVLNARIKVNADNCRVIGRGALLDPFTSIYEGYDEKKASQSGLIWVRDADDTQIDGVHLLNSYGFNVFVQGIWDRTYSKNTSVTNVKILSSELCSDGISFNYWNKDSNAEHCFVYCGDNALVYEDGAHYKDILIGTTCSALYPQTAVRNSSAEDIYVFRADDNIIRVTGSEGKVATEIDNSTVTNLYLQDVTYTNSFLHITGSSIPAKSTNGGFTIKNVYMPELSGIKSFFYQNNITGNYEVNLINVSVDGVAVPSIKTEQQSGTYKGYVFSEKSWGYINYPGSHTFTYTKTADFDPNLPKHSARLNYQNDLNVLIGVWQVFYSDPILQEGSDILLPLKQTQTELRTDKSATVTERDGVQYVAVSALVSSGMAKAVKTDGNNLVLTPNYNGENLLLPDTGIRSQFGESNPGYTYMNGTMTGGSAQLHLSCADSSGSYGLYFLLNEAVKKYGAGNYRLTFKARSDKATQLTASIRYGMGNATTATKLTAGEKWTEGTLIFTVSASYQNQLQIAISIVAEWVRDGSFDLTDLCLVKV